MNKLQWKYKTNVCYVTGSWRNDSFSKESYAWMGYTFIYIHKKIEENKSMSLFRRPISLVKKRILMNDSFLFYCQKVQKLEKKFHGPECLGNLEGRIKGS